MIAGLANGVIGTNLVFGNANRKRSLEFLDDDWSPTPGTTENSPVVHQAARQSAPLAIPQVPQQQQQEQNGTESGAGSKKEAKRPRKS